MKSFAAVSLVLSFLIAGNAMAGVVYTDSLSTPSDQGLISGGVTWYDGGEGLTVSWAVSENSDGSWHYEYAFTNQAGGDLQMLVSHFIIAVSDNLTESDIFNLSDDIEKIGIRTFGPEPGNPGFPTDETIWGLKLDLWNSQLVAAFDSYRMPMWGDFYSKDGGNPVNYAYNTDFGVEVANLHDYAGTPVDAYGDPLFKVLVPNMVPEPATAVLLGLGALLLKRRRP